MYRKIDPKKIGKYTVYYTIHGSYGFLNTQIITEK